MIGGRWWVRGYRQNVRTGDNGVRFALEDQITILRNKAGRPYLQLMPFVDMGATWNVSDNPNEQQDQRFLIGAGWISGMWGNCGSRLRSQDTAETMVTPLSTWPIKEIISRIKAFISR